MKTELGSPGTNQSVEDLLGLSAPAPRVERRRGMSFSCLFFSDVRKDISDAKKYEFARDITLFADRQGFEAVYIPERHFHEFGSIYANSALVAAYLIPQTQRIRFRTAGVSLPLHHPAEVVEWWAMNDVLSGGRVDLGFGSGWSKPDFVLAPGNYEERRQVCYERIPLVQRLWRGETVHFAGASGEEVPITVYPRPVQPELNVWLLAAQSDESFFYAGTKGYNVFTMLAGIDIPGLQKKTAKYREGRVQAGLDPESGTVSLMLHTLVHESREVVRSAVERPFKAYIESALNAHLKQRLVATPGGAELDDGEKAKMLEYSYQRYFTTAAMFGSVSEAHAVVAQAQAAGVNEIACLMDFGVDYELVKSSFSYLRSLVAAYV